MGNIVLLDELTINKIAAGEVIERPASVIKEMIENSIDAGATNITVEIKNGGISYIRVVDNGKGIAQDDLEIAFERHATSKIRTAEDLNTVTSMGFRGEALASIAAISNVELVSKTKGQQIGYKVVVEGGDVLSKEEAGCQVGTAITVQNLFYNTPVRYKFLKKDYTESGYIEDVITREALIHPEIAFKLVNTGKTVIQTTGNGDLKSVIYNIYGKDIEEATIDVNYEYEDIKVTGVVGKPEIARSNRTNQIFFVNKRYIKDKNLSAAVTEAFKGMIPIGKFGFVILNLEINPKKVDVNVHPAKLEVRFEEEAKVFKAIYHTIKDALLKTELVADPVKEKEEDVLSKDAEKVVEDKQDEKPEERQEDRIKEEKGLFGWRKNKKENVQTGEKPNIISQIYNEKREEELPRAIQKSIDKHGTENIKLDKSASSISGEPIDTFDVLEKLKKLKMQLEQEVNEHKKANADLEVKEDADTEYKESIESKTGEETAVVAEAKEEEKTEPLTKEELKQEMTEEEAKAEFKETKSKLDQMLNEQEEVSTDFTEMYLKTFGIMPPTEQIKQEEAKTKKQMLI